MSAWSSLRYRSKVLPIGCPALLKPKSSLGKPQSASVSPLCPQFRTPIQRAHPSWDIWGERLRLLATAIYVDANRLENDEPNLSTKIPDHYLVDVKLSGAYGPATWSAEVHNLFDKDYFNFGVVSTTNPKRFNTFPQPGRTFLVRAGVVF